MAEGPLTGVRVVELGELVAAPFAGRLLADFGADVVKVEAPEGDPARAYGPFAGGVPDRERGALFLYLNANKRLLTLDPLRAADRVRLRGLVATADLVLEGEAPGTLAAWGSDAAALWERNPRLALVSLTAHGRSGPDAGAPATNLTTLARGGLLALTGEPEREPLAPAGFQAEYQLGLHGFVAATAALLDALHTGAGQQAEVAGVECLASILEFAFNFYAYTGRSRGTRRGNVMAPLIGLYECADGHIGVHAMARNAPRLFELIGQPALFADPRFRTAEARLQHFDLLRAILTAWAGDQRREEVYARGGALRAPVAYVHSLADLFASPQLRARDFWRTLTTATGALTFPGPIARLSGSPARALAPPTPVADAAWPAERLPSDAPPADPLLRVPALPLAGVRVLDLTMVWAGPYATRLLADLGAEVLKVESHVFHDQIRNLHNLPPDTAVPWNKSAYFNHNARNKLGITLNLAHAEGRARFLDLVTTADVVIENFRAGVLEQLGISYETVRAVRPDIIVVSMPGHGASGPERDYAAYGTTIEQLAGLTALTGYREGGPRKSGISYGDPTAGVVAAGMTLTALLHRRRTGQGQLVEVAQREALISLIGEYVVGYSIDGVQPPPRGSRHPLYAPHGVYRARDRVADVEPDPPYEPWVALACEDDQQFAALCAAMGQAALARDARFAHAPARRAHEDELDARIGAWTATLDRDAVCARLRAAGVPCAPVQSVADLLADPHLRARGFFELVAHPDAGVWEMEGPVVRLSDTPAHIRLNAPRFGEHTAYALGTLLGLSAEQQARLLAHGVTAEQPNMDVHR